MKAVLPAVLLLTVSFAVIPSIESVQPILDEDIEDVYELIEEFIEPLLEYNDFSIDDLPYHLEYLIAKYYLVFTSTEAVQSLDTLEQMLNDYNNVNDYNKINNSLKKVADDFPEYIEHFNMLNLMGDEKALETFVDDLLPYFDFRLRVVSRRDAVKLLVYREAYPDIMQIVGTAVTVFCDEFWNDVVNDDGADPILLYRVLVGFHGRIYVVKHMISHLVSYFLPSGPTILDDDSMLDYLDDLKDLLEANSYRVWRFIKLPAYKMMTDEWIAIVETFLRDLLTFIPLAELSSFIDEVALNPNNRLAMIAVRYDREKSRRESRQLLHTDDSDATSSAAENIWDVLNGIRKFVVDAAAIVPDVLHDIVTGEHQFSEDTFLEYVNDVLVPYNMSTEDVSQELRSIVSRYFNRVDPVNKGQPLNDSEMKILESNVLLIRTYLEKVRDAIGNVPDPSEAHHIEFDGLLQYMVNKFGGSIFVMEKDFVNLFNSVREYRDSEQFVEDHVDNLMNRLYTLDSTFQLTGKKPSELLSERLSSLKELIDLFVEISTF